MRRGYEIWLTRGGIFVRCLKFVRCRSRSRAVSYASRHFPGASWEVLG